jgi:hypothetical protein
VPDFSWPPDVGVGGSGGAIEDWGGPPPPRDAEPAPVDASRPRTACEQAVERILVCGWDEGQCPAWQFQNLERADHADLYLEGCETSPALAVLVNNYQGDCQALMETLRGASPDIRVDCFGG